MQLVWFGPVLSGLVRIWLEAWSDLFLLTYVRTCLVWPGLVWSCPDLAGSLVGLVLACSGRAWHGLVWPDFLWADLVWCGLVWYGRVWYSLDCSGLRWLHLLWCGLISLRNLLGLGMV